MADTVQPLKIAAGVSCSKCASGLGSDWLMRSFTSSQQQCDVLSETEEEDEDLSVAISISRLSVTISFCFVLREFFVVSPKRQGN